MAPPRNALLAGLLTLACASAEAGAAVSYSGRMGDKALLVIDGTPRAVAVGSTVNGVKLLSAGSDTAVIESGGQRNTLRLGGTPVDLGGAPSAGTGTRIVLPAGPGGHFGAAGSINGRPVLFMVDTGATSVALSQAEADRIGLAYKDAPRGLVSTANGTIPAHSVRLASIRIGDVQVLDVPAVVLPAPMPQVLLGNSFLSRFRLQRDSDTMTLDKRP